MAVADDPAPTSPRPAPSWSVVSTVSEPLPLLMAFVAHHLEAGASEVVLYLDVPDPRAEAVLGAVPGCRTVRPLDRGVSPRSSVPIRQARNATHAYARATTDWLLHIDADEFLWRRDAVMAALAAAPEDQLTLGLNPMDRVWLSDAPPRTIFDGAFRTTLRNRAGAHARVYGDAARFLDMGMAGNGAEKSFVRTGRDVEMGVHRPTRRDGGPVPRVPVKGGRCLLHFDAATPANYVAKLRRKIRQQPNWAEFPAAGRRAQLHAVAEGMDAEELVRLAKTVTPEQAAALREIDAFHEVEFDPAPAILRVFGEAADLSVEAFDAETLAERRVTALDRAETIARRLARRILRRG
jgi:hypothetical protein